MSIKQIPASHLAVCDACKKERPIQSASRPSTWVDLKVYADVHDFQGGAVASNNTILLLCQECGSAVIQALNIKLDAIRKVSPK